MNQEKIGMFIKQKRLEKGLTQEQLASNLNITSKTVSRWERGLNIPDVSILQSLSIELGISTTELMLGEEENRNMSNDDYSKIGLDYSQNEIIQKITKFKRYLLISTIFSLLLLIDISYGYFSALLSWQINDRMIFPRGIIYSLLYENSVMNYEGIVLTNMFYIFIMILTINILFVIIYVILTLYQNKLK